MAVPASFLVPGLQCNLMHLQRVFASARENNPGDIDQQRWRQNMLQLADEDPRRERAQLRHQRHHSRIIGGPAAELRGRRRRVAFGDGSPRLGRHWSRRRVHPCRWSLRRAQGKCTLCLGKGMEGLRVPASAPQARARVRATLSSPISDIR